MKKLIGLAIFALAISFGASAQDIAADKASRAKAQSERMAKELNLTPEQIAKKDAIDAETQAKYKEINQSRQKVMEMRAALPQDATPEKREEISNMMKELREKQMLVRKEANEKLKSLLNEEQLKKFNEMRTVKKPNGKMTPAPRK